MKQVIGNPFISLSLILAATVFVYYPGLAEGFYFDDFVNIVDNRLLQVETLSIANFWQATWSGLSGPLGRPLSYLSFSVNWYFTGENAYYMKITNLVIHCLVGLLLYFLTNVLVTHLNRSRSLNVNVNFICIFVCAAWLLHPFNLTSVLYVVQRMTSLAALFTICAILCYTHFRIKQTQSKGHWFPLISSTALFAFIAMSAKETAFMLVFYIACIEIFIFRFSAHDHFDRVFLKSCFYILFPSIFIATYAFFALNPDWLERGYALRNFSLLERLLTEFRIVVWYLKMALAPDISQMSLFLDDFEVSKSFFQPFTTIASAFLIALLLLIGVLARSKLILVSFGIFWFFSGHLMESTFLPLELAYEHRNYLPTFGLIISLAATIEYLLKIQKLRVIAVSLSIVWVSLLGYTTYLRADRWKNPVSLAISDVEYHPESIRANDHVAGVYASLVQAAENQQDKDVFFEKADFHYKKAGALDKVSHSSMLTRVILYSMNDRKLPEIELNEVLTSLENKIIDSSTVNALKKLTSCQIAEVCKLSVNDYMRIMYAPISQQNINKRHLALILLFLSEYYVVVLNDYDTAIKITRAALEEHTNDIHHRFILVKWLGSAGQYKDALKELEIIREQDKFSVYSSNINDWEELLKSSINGENAS